MTQMSQQQGNGSSEPLIGLEASRRISERLANSARKLRFSTSSRSNLYKAVGLRPRLSDRIFTVLMVVLIIFNVIIPNAAAIAYFGFFASGQYESEARFTVRTSVPAMGKDQLGKVTGIPSAKIVQDTQIVINFISSHEMLDALRNRGVDLKKLYGNDSIDFGARLPQDASAEEMKKYWEKMVSTFVSPSSGIVTVKVRAFTAEDAVLLVNEVIKASEIVVNQVNDRIWKDVVSTAETNLTNATRQLETARQAIANARNRDGVLTVEGSAQIISHLVSTMEAERLTLQQRYDSQLAVVSPDAPQMRVLSREIRSKEQQIADLNKQVAGSGIGIGIGTQSGKGARNLADVSQDLSQLQLAQTLAEQQFSSSVKTVEQIRFISRQQLMYLDSFLTPRLPDEPAYPKKALWIALTLIGSLMIWGVMVALLYFARSRLSH